MVNRSLDILGAYDVSLAAARNHIEARLGH